MNLPNKLTLFRVFLIPVFTVIFLGQFFECSDELALAIFIVASVTDFLDGYLARKNHMVTDFGKLMDPLADKLLVTIALVCCVRLRINFPAWCCVVIIAREFIISGFRQLACEKGVVIQAGYWGKFKTVVQLFACMAYIWDPDIPGFATVELLLIYAATLLTIISLIDYLYKNRKLMTLATK